MSVPGKSLLWGVALAIPLLLSQILWPAGFRITLLYILILSILAGIDALLTGFQPYPFTFKFPENLRLAKGSRAALAVQLEHRDHAPRWVRIALPLDSTLQPDNTEMTVILSREAMRLSLPFSLEPLQRGLFKLQDAYIERPSALGFFHMRNKINGETIIRVYPNLRQERKNLASFFLHRGFSGIHAIRQIGKGREFEKVREYIPGDCFEDIHWKATAKRSQLITKEFQVERTQEIYCILDTSRLCGRRHTESQGYDSLLEHYITLSLVLAQVVEKQGDLFGLITFHSQVDKFLRARSGKDHFAACRDSIYALKPHKVNPDFQELITFIRSRIRRRAYLLFLTQLDDPLISEQFLQTIEMLRASHLVHVNAITLPHIRPLFHDTPPESVADAYAHLGGHLTWLELQELGTNLKRLGMPFTLLSPKTAGQQLISQYLAVKQKQVL